MTRRANAVLVVTLLLAAMPPAEVRSQAPPPQWGELDPGPHPVGFRVYRVVDPSRRYVPERDWRGRPAEGETARPVHVRLWYPATPRPRATSMPFGHYLDIVADPLEPAGLLPDEREAYVLGEFFRGPMARWHSEGPTAAARRAVLDTPTSAFLDAPFADGAFPVVIHAGYGATGQSVLNEYLASHGYVVAGFPSLSEAPWSFHRGSGRPEWYQAVADDVGFVYGFLERVPVADRSRVAGMGMFSAAALIFQMREMALDAIVSLEGRYPAELRRIPGYGVEKVRIPILDAVATGTRHDSGILDSLRYSERTLVRFDDVPHGDFYQFPRVARPDSAAAHTAYRVIARAVRAFLDARLKEDERGDRILETLAETSGVEEGFVTVRRLEALPAVPTEAEFLRLLRERRFEAAREALAATRRHEPDTAIAAEDAIRDVAMFLRRDWGVEGAIPALEILVDLHPRSLDGWVFLSSAYATADRSAEADRALETALRQIRELDTAPSRLRWLAGRLLAFGHHEGAIDLLHVGVERDPASPVAHAELSRAYERAGDLELARTHAVRALELIEAGAEIDPGTRRSLESRVDRLRPDSR